MIDDIELLNRFTHHPPTSSEQTMRYEQIRDNVRQVAKKVVELTPESREQSLAVTKLEEAVFWANAAIARHEQ